MREANETSEGRRERTFKIAIAAFFLLWGLLWNRLESFDSRLRAIEGDTRAIRATLDSHVNQNNPHTDAGPMRTLPDTALPSRLSHR